MFDAAAAAQTREPVEGLAGLVAIVADDASVVVDAGELDALAASHEALRGQRGRWTFDAGERLHGALLAPGGDGLAELEHDEGSFAAAVGVVHRDGALVEARLEDLEGHFALVRYDAASGDVVVATDPLAFQPVYTARRNGKTYVSDSALVLARHLRAAPSRLGMLTFLRSGYHFGTMTSWEGVERLNPGTVLRIGADGRRDTGFYWRPSVDADIARLRFDRTVDAMLELTLDTCGRWLGGREPTWCDLTGGYDGRLLSLLLAHEGIPFDVNTRGDYMDDRRIAREVVRITGWDWSDLIPPRNWADIQPGLLPGTVAWSDGHLDPLELSWVLWAHELLSERHRSLLYAGGGEHMRGYAWRQEFGRAGKTTKVNFDNWVDLRLIHALDTSVFAQDPTPEVRADMLHRMRGWVAPYSDELNTVQCDVMFVYKMTGHFGIYRSADGRSLRAQVPMYNKQVYDAAISANHRWRRGHRLERHMIWRLDPRVAAIETDSGGPAAPWRPTNLHQFVPYYTQLARKATNKLTYKYLGRPILTPVEKGSWWCPPDARRAVVRELLGNHRNGGLELRCAPLFDERRLRELLRAARDDGDFTATTLLGRIVGVELALRHADAALER